MSGSGTLSLSIWYTLTAPLSVCVLRLTRDEKASQRLTHPITAILYCYHMCVWCVMWCVGLSMCTASMCVHGHIMYTYILSIIEQCLSARDSLTH
mmetsp:Transcript_29462/g.73372  ORF Transcript_29462/g.73372 Transcript_29462/m.73372 type:complete len:95 (-) Transcript_29462:1167-1451(-)